MTTLTIVLTVHPLLKAEVGCGNVSPEDTIHIFSNLPELEVTAFETTRPRLLQAVSLEIIGKNELQAYSSRSLSEVINSKPGIKLEERATASYRISIRGSSLRSPFGVRNVKVFWNDLPLTLSDGTTPLNLIDPESLKSIEILKGPAGSIYGSGNGGVVKLYTETATENPNLNAAISTGSQNMLRTGFNWSQHHINSGFSVGFNYSKSDGFRNHSAKERSSIYFSAQLFPKVESPVSLYILYTDLKYEIPGGLNRSQLEVNPRQARPGSAEQNSSIDQKTILAGLTSVRELGKGWFNRTAVYFTSTDFDHPFILDYKTELSTDMGGRSAFQWDTRFRQWPVRIIFGGEIQRGRNSAGNFGNIGGIRDSIRFLDDITTLQWTLFQQIEIEPSAGWIISAGLSQNRIHYSLDRKVNAITGTPFAVSRNFSTVLIPRLSVSKKLDENTAVFAALSGGFSPPTLNEFRTNEGSLNENLEAEIGMNAEVGLKKYVRDRNLSLEAGLFYFRLNETITNFTDANGVVLFRNAGATDQFGIEVALDYAIYRSNKRAGIQIGASHAYAGHFFRFRNFESGGLDLSGNQLTGVSPHTLHSLLHFRINNGLGVFIRHQYSDQTPLNDENTVFQGSWNVFGAKMTWKLPIIYSWELSFGVENITDRTYGLGNDLNAFGGRYFQPSPGRHWYLGLKYSGN